MSERKILIIAGPNGAGKTTFAQEFLPGEAGCPHFVNADLIAAGLTKCGHPASPGRNSCANVVFARAVRSGNDQYLSFAHKKPQSFLDVSDQNTVVVPNCSR